MKKYKIEAISKEKRVKFLKNLMEAAVNPDYLKKVSEILKRELAAEKDTEDYNNRIISSYFDRSSVVLREVGQKAIVPGDVFRIEETIQAKEQDREELHFFLENRRAVGTYQFFPFTWKLGQELRSHFILKTEKNDNFDSLLDEADGLIFNFLTIDDWTLLKSGIKKAEDRIRSNKIRFLQPEMLIGDAERITNQEMETYSIEGLDKNTTFIDNRSDDHDLLAFKEFLSLLKGEEVHPLTIGPGFFAKYMPELIELGVNGIIFKVVDDKLVEIKLNKKEDSVLVDFSPIDAANCLVEKYCSYTKKSFFTKEVKEYKLGDLFKENSKYYVVVNGCIAAPEKGLPLNYESASANKVKVEAGEVFLFESVDNQIQNTRLYFVPYSYKDLHLVHQHGSVIFGNNDQSLNSCVKNEKDFFDEYSLEAFLDKVEEDDKILYDPAFLAAAIHLLPEGSDPELLLEPENREVLLKAMGSLFEETNFTIEHLMKEYVSIKESGFDLISLFLKNYSPLSKRFVLGKYFEDGSGLMLERMETTYAILSRRMYLDYHINLMRKDFGTKKKKDK